MKRTRGKDSDSDLPIAYRLFRGLGGLAQSERRLTAESPFPLDRVDNRVLDPAFEGTVYTWDIDKTYLDTEFHGIGSLVKVAMEFAIDKQAIAGTVPLLRGIRRGPTARSRQTPLYFVSASPPQLRHVIERKMLIDGVDFDGITLKDQFTLVKRGRFGQIKQHLGYKLSALLLNRRDHPQGSREILFGDDSESDALIYDTYARVIAGELRGGDLVQFLMQRDVPSRIATHIASLADGLRRIDAVKGIFIHRALGRSVESIAAQGSRVFPSHSPFQAAMALWEWGEVDRITVVRTARDVVDSGAGGQPELLEWVSDAFARGAISGDTAGVWRELVRDGLQN